MHFYQELVSGYSPSLDRQIDSPVILEIPTELKIQIPKIHKALQESTGNLADIYFQDQLRNTLNEFPAWSDWINASPKQITTTPVLVRSGLGTELDNDIARKMLVGLAVSLQPLNYVPPYEVDNLAVTEVIAEAGSTKESHSKNDLPAPPHCAGFFEKIPPHTCYFSCIRPHRKGGAQTTVLNLNSILNQAPHDLIEEWSTKTYYYRTSKRLGEEIKPMKLLSWIDDMPFLRYRKEYMENFDTDPSLKFLEELVINPANHFQFLLQAGETIAHWNGAPHSRMPQNGPTPKAVELRRKLIRCRTVPKFGWEGQFE